MPHLIPDASRPRPIPHRRSGGIIALTCLSLGLGCSPANLAKPSPPKNSTAPRPVRLANVAVHPLERTVKATGSLAAHDQAVLSTKVPGRVEEIFVDIGSPVRRGERLAQIERRDYELRLQQTEALLFQARARLGLPPHGETDQVDPDQTSTVRQARALLAEARANRDRIRQLSAQKILSASEVETAEAAHDVAQSRYEAAVDEIRQLGALAAQRRAELAIARQQLQDTLIESPFDGNVQERRAQLGEFLPASTPVVIIVRTNPLRLQLDVAERDAARIRLGQPIRLSLEGWTNTFAATVDRLSPALNPESRMLRLESDLANAGQLRAGSFARAEIIVETAEPAVTVPRNALATFAGVEKVFVIESGKAAERPVATGRRTADRIEILRGVTPADRIVLDPGNLQNGQPVQPEEPTPANDPNPRSAPGGRKTADTHPSDG